MLVECKCNKCGEIGKLDIEDMTKDQVQEWLEKDTKGFECFGHHLELGKRSDYWTVDWDSLKNGKGPSEEEFLKGLTDKCAEVLDTEQLQEKYTVTGFGNGQCYVREKATFELHTFDYTSSPSGKRYYYM